jgi:mannose-6-phosphate isomerase-like protein (cupin superfamily)
LTGPARTTRSAQHPGGRPERGRYGGRTEEPAPPTGPEEATVLTVLTASDLLLRPPSRTVKFEGAGLDADVAFFVVDLDPGGGPEAHRHPYAEVFIPLSGTALFRSGDERREAGPGEIVVVGPQAEHGFTNVGEDRLNMVCIHAAGTMATDWLDGRGFV